MNRIKSLKHSKFCISLQKKVVYTAKTFSFEPPKNCLTEKTMRISTVCIFCNERLMLSSISRKVPVEVNVKTYLLCHMYIMQMRYTTCTLCRCVTCTLCRCVHYAQWIVTEKGIVCFPTDKEDHCCLITKKDGAKTEIETFTWTVGGGRKFFSISLKSCDLYFNSYSTQYVLVSIRYTGICMNMVSLREDAVLYHSVKFPNHSKEYQILSSFY